MNTQLSPYKLNPVPPTIALLTEEGKALDEHGELHSLDALPKGTRTYGSWDAIDELLRAGVGETYCWDGEPIRWRHRHFADLLGWENRHSDVVVLRLPFPEEQREALAGLVAWRDWLARYRAAPQGSLGSSAMSLLRATLRTPVPTARGQLPPVRWTLGGRQELTIAPRTSIRGAQHFDLPAAYASTLALLRYGGIWREVFEPANPALWAADERPVFCHATVRVPALRFGPIPRRPLKRPPSSSWDRSDVLGNQMSGVFPTRVTMRGVWVWDELAEAELAGADVRVDRLWVHLTDEGELGRPFLPWWAAVLEGRAMPGLGGQLAKAAANALWGQFCISAGQRELVFYDAGGRRKTKRLPATGGGAPRSWDLAELITGRVRARLGAMMRFAGDHLLSVHTDGGWLRQGLEPPPGWLVKDNARRLDIIGPQMLRYWRPAGGGVLHRVAGVPTRRAEEVFARLWDGAA